MTSTFAAVLRQWRYRKYLVNRPRSVDASRSWWMRQHDAATPSPSNVLQCCWPSYGYGHLLFVWTLEL